MNPYQLQTQDEWAEANIPQGGGMGGSMGSGMGGGYGDLAHLLPLLQAASGSPELQKMLLPLLLQNMMPEDPNIQWEKEMREKEFELAQASEFMDFGRVEEANAIYNKWGYSTEGGAYDDPIWKGTQDIQYDPEIHKSIPQWEEVEFEKSLAPDELRDYKAPISYQERVGQMGDSQRQTREAILKPFGSSSGLLSNALSPLLQAFTMPAQIAAYASPYLQRSEGSPFGMKPLSDVDVRRKRGGYSLPE